MKIIPVRKYKTVLYFSPIEFEKKLKLELERSNKKKSNFFKSTEPVFKGWVKNNIFILSRQGYGNTTMLPEIEGKFEKGKSANETELELNIHYSFTTNLFLILWSGIVGMVFIASAFNSIKYGKFNIGIPVSIGMLLFLLIFMSISFSIELETIKRYFKKTWFVNLKK